MTRSLPAAAVAGLLLCAGGAAFSPRADGQPGAHADARFAGLEWTFVRIRYTAWTVPRGGFLSPEDEPWFIDAPAAEQNLSRRVRTVTSIKVNDPIVLTLEDPELWAHPWIYIVEGGNLRLKDAEVPILREFLLRGGTLTFDDFHGPLEWANVESELRRVFPDRKIIDLPPAHPIFHCFYQFDSFPADAGARVVPAGTHLREGRLRRAPARHRGRQRARDGADQLERRHGGRVGMVERVRVPGLREIHCAGVPDGDQRTHLLADALMESTTDIAAVAERVAQGRERILAEIRKVIVGQDDVIDQVLMALFTGGHCLITGVPGLAKTLLIKTVAQILDLSFKRIQFTPDLMPADITGTEVLDEEGGAPIAAVREGADLRPDPAGRRDQPHAAQDAGGAARGDAGIPRHRRGPDLSARAAVLRARDAESDRAGRHVSAPGSAARSLHVQHRHDVPLRGRRGPRRDDHDRRRTRTRRRACTAAPTFSRSSSWSGR